jgi:hypothetical protein
MLMRLCFVYLTRIGLRLSCHLGEPSRGDGKGKRRAQHRRAREHGSKTYGTGNFPKAIRAFPRTRWRRRHHYRLPPRPAAGSAVREGCAASCTPVVTVDAEERRRLELAGAELHLILPYHHRI